MQNGRSDGYGSVRHMLTNPLNASDGEMQMKAVCECVLVSQEDMQHLDPREIIPDGGRCDGTAEKLNICTNGIEGGRQGVSAEVHTKPKVAAKLGPQIGIGPSGKGM